MSSITSADQFSCGFNPNLKKPPEVLYKEKQTVLENFAKFTGKKLCRSLFFGKVTGRRFVTLLRKRLGRSCFLVNFAKFLRAPFL